MPSVKCEHKKWTSVGTTCCTLRVSFTGKYFLSMKILPP